MELNSIKNGCNVWSTVVFWLFAFGNCAQFEFEPVTMGSVIKLNNKQHNVRLHSHDVKYGSGSGQQSVTGMTNKDDANSYWQVRNPTAGSIARGTPIKCGNTIRLMHIKTTANLHTHHFQSPLTNEQEVSAFGSNGEGDDLDNWQVICSSDIWKRSEYIKFKHLETKAFLAASHQTYGRPINGQREIMSSRSDDNGKSRFWKVEEGIFIKANEMK